MLISDLAIVGFSIFQEGLEVHARSATTDDKLSEEETHEARRQQ